MVCYMFAVILLCNHIMHGTNELDWLTIESALNLKLSSAIKPIINIVNKKDDTLRLVLEKAWKYCLNQMVILSQCLLSVS